MKSYTATVYFFGLRLQAIQRTRSEGESRSLRRLPPYVGDIQHGGCYTHRADVTGNFLIFPIPCWHLIGYDCSPTIRHFYRRSDRHCWAWLVYAWVLGGFLGFAHRFDPSIEGGGPEGLSNRSKGRGGSEGAGVRAAFEALDERA